MFRTDSPAPVHFYQLIEAHAENPHIMNRIAIYSDDENKITYQELNNRVNQLAYYLLDIKNAVNLPESQIGLFFYLSIEYVICQLAIMKAGLSFVAFSANTDVERLKEFTKDKDIKLIISDSMLQNHSFLTTSEIRVFYLNTQQHTLNQYPINNPAINVNLNHLAYIHNTSGSTGKPKQVLINHAGLLNCATDLINRLYITEQDKTAAFADISFDAHIAEMMMTLGAGAALYLVPASTRLNYLSLTQYYNSHGITVSTLTPSVLSALSPAAFPSLRVLLSTGEAVTQKIVAKWGEANSRLLFVNGYGPAEVTIATSIAILKPNDPIHIGEPIKGLNMYVLEKEPIDKNSPQRVLPGERGEMYIGGIGVGRGYADETLTAERFKLISNPDKPDEKIRLYQTRDEARYELYADNSHRFYVTGRLDRQLKVYGKLICPEEIEALLLTDNVIQAQIDPQKTALGHPAFIAYLYIKEPFDLYEYYVSIVKKFPAATAPALWVISDKILLSGSGKNALKSANITAVRVQSPSQRYPENSLENELVLTWKNVLEISDDTKLTVDDNFFMLGGTSLQMANLLVILREQYRLKLNPTEFSYFPTIGSLARRIRRQKKPDGRLHKPILLNEKHAILNKETPLFLIHSLIGDAEMDYAKLIEKWPGQRPIYGITSRSYNDSDDMDNTLEAIAFDYIETIKSIQPRGPYLLGGWSAGGLIAYAMSQILKDETIYLHMIDTEGLATYRQKNREEYASYLLLLFELKLSSMLGIPEVPVTKSSLASLPKFKQIYYFFDALLKVVETTGHIQPEHNHSLLQRKKGLISTVKNTLVAILNYSEGSKIENTILWAASQTQKKCADEQLNWLGSAINFTSIKVLDGNHESILLDSLSAKTLSVQLERECTQQIEVKQQIQVRYFNRPSFSNPSIIERTNLLNDLHKIFHRIGRNQDIVIISHPQSIGKSRVAEQYINHHQLDYVLKIWFRADTKKALLEDYEKLARQLNLTMVGNNVEKVVKNYLESNNNWLAVYDNAALPKEIKHLFPANNGHIIVTSQYPEWVDIGLDVGIDYLPATDCLRLLPTISEKSDSTETQAQNILIAELNKSSLAICQLGAYLSKSGQTARQFLSHSEHERTSGHYSPENSVFYKKNITYGILINALIKTINDDISHDAHLKYSIIILQALVHLHTMGGNYALLKSYLQQIEPTASDKNLELFLDKSIEHLQAYFLIRYDYNRRVISMNNSTQEMLKHRHLAFSEQKNILFLIKALNLSSISSDIVNTNLTILAENLKQFAPHIFHEAYAAIYAGLSEMYACKLNTIEAIAHSDKMLKVSALLDNSQQVIFYQLHKDYIETLCQHKQITFKSIISSAKRTDNLFKSFHALTEEQANTIKLKRIKLLVQSLIPALMKTEQYTDCLHFTEIVKTLIQNLQLTIKQDFTLDSLNYCLFQAELFNSYINSQLSRTIPGSGNYVLSPACFEQHKILENVSNNKLYWADLNYQRARLQMLHAEDTSHSTVLYNEAWQSLVITFNLRFESMDLNQIIPLLNEMALCCYHLNDSETQFYLNSLAVIIYKKYFMQRNCHDDIGRTYELLAMLKDKTLLGAIRETTVFYLEIAKWHYAISGHPRADVIKQELSLHTSLSVLQIEKLTTAYKKTILNTISSLNEFLAKKQLLLTNFGQELLDIGSELSRSKWEEPGLKTPLTTNQNTFFSPTHNVSVMKDITPNLPWPQNSLFTGRDEFLVAIDQSLPAIAGHEKSIVFAIHGLSGTGKTQMAVQFAHNSRILQKYKLIWYLSAVNLVDGFLELSDAFNISLNDPPQKRIAAAKIYLQKNYGGTSLIIIDDAKDYATISSLFLEISGTHFLVTTNNAAEWPFKQELVKFNRTESLQVIEKILTNEAEKNPVDANELADLLGDLPLALAQACAYIQSNCSISEYIQLYNRQRQELWFSEQAPKDYPVTVAVAFELAFKNVKELLPIQELEELLGYCVYLQQDSIPKWLLKSTMTNPAMFSKIIQTLVNFSLLQASAEKISLHKILQQVIRDKLNFTPDKVIALLLTQSISSDSTIALANNRELLAHYDAVLEDGSESTDSLKLFFIAGLTHLRLGNPHKASILFNSAIRLKLAEVDNDFEYAMMLDYLGTAYGEIGLHKLKKETLLKSLDVKLKLTKSDDCFNPEFARTYNNLANAYGAENNLPMHLLYLEKAYQIQVHNLGESHPESALIQANLAVVYNQDGQKIKSKRYFEGALSILKSHYGENHFHVGRLLNNYASNIGPLAWDEAHRYAYVVDIDVVDGVVKCALINCAERQRELLEQAVAIQKHNFDEKNINVSHVQSNLARVYGALNLWSKQKHLLETIAPVYEKFYGPDNVLTLEIKEQLGKADRVNNAQTELLSCQYR